MTRRLTLAMVCIIVAFAAVDAMSVVRLRRVDRLAPELSHAIVAERRHTLELAIGVQSLAAAFSLVSVALALAARRQQRQLARERDAIAAQERHAAIARAAELELFASRAAHDLKAPLSSVLLYVKSQGPASPSTDTTRLIADTVASAIEMVDAMLDYARAGASIDTSSATVDDVVTHIMQASVRHWIAAAGGGVHVDVSVEPELAAGCARGAVMSIVTNLLRNAFVHAVPAGARRIELSAARRGDRVRLEVRDDGPGVPAELRAHIFEPYVSGDERLHRGLGLGLATVKRFAEGCGGAVGLDDTASGASFWVELPA